MTAPRKPSAFGTDQAEAETGGGRVILCPASKGWLARKPKTLTSAEHPGTAVRWDDEIFEVVEAFPGPDGTVRYRLEPWDSRHAIRTVSNYDAASERSRESEQIRRRVSIHKRWLSILFAPVLGHLPGEVQTRMESEFGAPARFMTIASALPLFLLGALGACASQIAAFGGGEVFPSWLTDHPFIAIYLAGESGFRLASAFIQGEPMGSLPGTLIYEAWKALRARPSAPVARANKVSTPQTSLESDELFKILEPLLALLPSNDQLLLESRFAFDFRRWGRFSAIALFVIGGLNLLIAFGQFAQDLESFWDFFWIPAGVYVVIEQFLRWRRLASNRPAGSVLGFFVRPITLRLLDDSPLSKDRGSTRK
jgi:hypothetical protein